VYASGGADGGPCVERSLNSVARLRRRHPHGRGLVDVAARKHTALTHTDEALFTLDLSLVHELQCALQAALGLLRPQRLARKLGLQCGVASSLLCTCIVQLLQLVISYCALLGQGVHLLRRMLKLLFQ
jgi:hypothetical protein